jgi:hypothetical protein
MWSVWGGKRGSQGVVGGETDVDGKIILRCISRRLDWGVGTG